MDARGGPDDDRSLGRLFADLSAQLSSLIRQEIDLARTEMTVKATGMTRDAALIGVGGALIYAATLTLLAAIVLLLIDLGLTPWIAALAVSIVVAAVGLALVLWARDQMSRRGVAPTRTVDTIKDDAEWAKERLS
jgi:VIT1/CCC1 family predicted Fe2+/Mn2+ transporter